MTLKLQKNDAPAGPYDNSNVNNRISHKFSSYVLRSLFYIWETFYNPAQFKFPPTQFASKILHNFNSFPAPCQKHCVYEVRALFFPYDWGFYSLIVCCVLHVCFNFSLAIYKTLNGQDDSIYLQQSCLTLF